MTLPVSFQVAQGIGNNLSRAFTDVKDSNEIDRILQESMNGGPEELQNNIAQILSQVSPEKQGTAIQFLQNRMQNIEQKKKAEQTRLAETQAGVTPGLHPTLQAQQLRNAAPPKPAGGLTGQATPPEVSQAISNVIQNNPSAKADDLALAFDKAQVPRAFSNSYIESRRRQDETNVSQNIATKKESRKELLDFHKESQKYDEDLLKQGKVAKSQIETIKNIEKSIKSGNVKPSSLANIFKGMGSWGDKISEALLNEDQATLLTSIPQLLEGWKEVFGVRLTDADLKLLQDKLPSIGKNESANLAVTKILRKYADMTLLRSQIANDIKRDNAGLRPLGYADKIEQRFDDMTSMVKVINPKTGNVIEIPAYKVSDAIKSGAKLANE